MNCASAGEVVEKTEFASISALTLPSVMLASQSLDSAVCQTVKSAIRDTCDQPKEEEIPKCPDAVFFFLVPVILDA